MTKLSIIVPVYNVEDYLKEAIDSILYQTFTDLEVLLINDGSTDNSSFICDRYAKLDPRVKVFHQHNQGVSIARNLGLDNAKGTYITFIDPDDYLVSSSVYEKIFSTISDDIDIIHFGFQREISSSNYMPKLTGYFTKPDFINKMFSDFVGNKDDRYFERFIMSSMSTLIIKKEIIGNIRFQRIKRTEDRLFFFEVIFASKNIFVMNDLFYFYRMNPNSATQTYNSQFIKDMIFSNDYQRSIFKNNDIELLISEEFNNSVVYQFYSAIINETNSQDIHHSIQLIKEYSFTQDIDKILTWKKTLFLGKKNPLWFLIKLRQYRILILLYKLYKN